MHRLTMALVVVVLAAAACAAPATPTPTAAPKPAATTPAPATAPPAPSAAAAPTSATAPAKAAAGPAARVEPLSPPVHVKIAVNPQAIYHLPILYAMDKGYFQRAGVDLEMVTYRTSSVTQLPLLARGDIDLSAAGPGPSLFNQAAQGFNAKIIAGLDYPTKGRVQSAWLAVLKEKANEIKDLKDLKGKTVDGGAEGTPIQLLVLEAVRQAGLTPGQDVTVTYRARTTPDEATLAKAKGADVIGMIEPLATQLEKDGTVVRWKGMADIVPWYQGVTIAASGKFLQEQPAAAQKFLEVYLATVREIDATNGEWTTDLANVAAKGADVDPRSIKDQGGVPYYDPNGKIAIDSLQRLQDMLVEQNQVQQKVDIQTLVDSRPLDRAVQKLGRAP